MTELEELGLEAVRIQSNRFDKILGYISLTGDYQKDELYKIARTIDAMYREGECKLVEIRVKQFDLLKDKQ